MSTNSPAPAIYGGDEVSAIVLDTGTWTTRAGFAGEDSPKAVFSTYYGVQDIKESSIKSKSAETNAENVTNGNSTDTKSEAAEGANSEKDKDGDVKMDEEPKSESDDTRTKPGSKLKSANANKKYFIGDNSIHVPRGDTEILNPMVEGVVQDWEGMERIWNHALNTVLEIDMREHPFLITEQTWNPRSNRAKAMELAFESFEVPAFYIAKSPVASLFASGKGSGLVVDVGHEIVSVTPVIDGLPLYKPSRRSLYAGKFLSNEVRHMLETKYESTFPHIKTAINTPRYTIASRQIPLKLEAEAQVVLRKFPNAIVNGVPTASFKEFEIHTRTLDEFKHTICQISDTPYKADMEPSVGKRVFEFPDGSNYSFGADRLTVTESLFQPSLNEYQFDGFPVPSTAKEQTESSDKTNENGSDKDSDAHESTADKKEPAPIPGATGDKKEGASTGATTGATNTASQVTPSYMLNDVRSVPPFSRTLGLSDLIVSSINACDVDVRHNLANNIVITGGSSLVQGLTDRINQDLSQALPGLKIRLYAPGNMTERNFSPWVGGSILASLGTFHQLWVSKKEYDEVGVDKLLDRRFR